MEANLEVRLASNKDIEAIHGLILPLAQEKNCSHEIVIK